MHLHLGLGDGPFNEADCDSMHVLSSTVSAWIILWYEKQCLTYGSVCIKERGDVTAGNHNARHAVKRGYNVCTPRPSRKSKHPSLYHFCGHQMTETSIVKKGLWLSQLFYNA